MGDRLITTSGCLRIGLCYDLKSDYIAEGVPAELVLGFETIKTIEAITTALEKADFTVTRLGNIRQLVQQLAQNNGKLDCDLVFNIHSGVYGLARESQVPGILEAYQIPFTMSDSAAFAWCMDKAKTKMVLESTRIATAPFVVIPALFSRDRSLTVPELFEAATAKSRHTNKMSKFPLFLKPVGQTSSTGISPSNKVLDISALYLELERLSIDFPTNDILVETFLTGREFTVGIIGTGLEARCIGITEMKFQTGSKEGPDFYADVFKSLDVSIDMESFTPDKNDPQVKATIDVALQAWRAMGCRDCGRVDIRLNSGGLDATPHILELQPLPGLRPGISDLPLLAEAAGISYERLICMIVESAINRICGLTVV